MVKKDENGIYVPISIFRSPVTWVFILGGLSAFGFGGLGIANGTAQADEIKIEVARNTQKIEDFKEDIKEIKEDSKEMKRMLREISRKVDRAHQ